MVKRKQKSVKIAGFINKLISILKNKEHEDVIVYDEHQRSFTIKNVRMFTEQILPQYFKHRNYSSFVRQVNLYDFRKIRQQGKQEAYHQQFFDINCNKELRKIKRKPMGIQKHKPNKKDSNSSEDSEQQCDDMDGEQVDEQNPQMKDGLQAQQQKVQERNNQIEDLQKQKSFLQNKIRSQQMANERLQYQNNKLRLVFWNQNLQFYQQILKILQNLLISQFNQEQITVSTYQKLIKYIYEEKQILELDNQSRNHHNEQEQNKPTNKGLSRESNFLALVKKLLSSEKHHCTIPQFVQLLLQFTQRQQNTAHPDGEIGPHLFHNTDHQAIVDNQQQAHSNNVEEQKLNQSNGQGKHHENMKNPDLNQNHQEFIDISNGKIKSKNRKKDKNSEDQDYVPKYR